jgi:hypothetical protein
MSLEVEIHSGTCEVLVCYIDPYVMIILAFNTKFQRSRQ